MKFKFSSDLMPLIIILLCCSNVFFLAAYLNTNSSLHNVASQVPKIAENSYFSGCVFAMQEFSPKSNEEILTICSQDSKEYSQPIEHLFNGSN